MHILNRIKPSRDPWEKVVLLSLQQLADDMRINEKRVCALEKGIVALSDALVGTSGDGQRDPVDVAAVLEDLHEEIRAWSNQSLDRAEGLAVVVRQVVSEQKLERAVPSPIEKKRLAS